MRSLVAYLVFCLVPLAAVDIGAPAPGLDGVAWVKGEPAKAGDGAVTVVEFWATWCGPCRQSIPHLTKLQKAHPDVVVIGLSKEDRATVEPFVTKQGDKMDYRVGVADAATHDAWMEGVNGIPHAFLVGKDGTVLWAGHPLEMDGPLDQVIAGTWDAKKQGELAHLREQLQEMFSGQGGQPDLEQAFELTGKMLAIDPADELGLKARLALAKQLEKRDDFTATLAALPVDQLDAQRLNAIAWDLLTEQDFAWRAPEVAARLARAAKDKAPDSSAILDTWARALYQLGLVDQAIAAQGQAVAAAKTAGEDADELERNLDYLQQVKQLQGAVAGGLPTTPAPKPPAVEPAVP